MEERLDVGRESGYSARVAVDFDLSEYEIERLCTVHKKKNGGGVTGFKLFCCLRLSHLCCATSANLAHEWNGRNRKRWFASSNGI